MPGLDGMDVVRRIREKDIELPHFIFVTAHDHYAVEAFRLEAMDYLLKPVDKTRLAETIDRARALFRTSKRRAPAAAPESRSGPSCWCAMRTATSSWTLRT